MRIIFHEPLCAGVVHAPFNAALVRTALAAWPEDQGLFLGEPGHIAHVRGLFERHWPEEASRMQWQAAPIRPESGGWRIMRAEWAGYRRTLDEAAAPGVRCLLLCAASGSSLLPLKMLMHARRTNTPVVAVLHGVLGYLAEPSPKTPWRWALSLRQTLRIPHPKALRYIALGLSIHARLAEVVPWASPWFDSMDHPYFWEALEPASPPDNAPVCFGFLGVTDRQKGFDAFIRLARDVRAQIAEARFLLVGHLGAGNIPADAESLIEGVGREPLPPAAYASRARETAYAVWTGNPAFYQLTASASFLDALSFLKPVICLRNPYAGHYFERMGDIGYLCDTYEDVRRTMESVASAFPSVRYRQQQLNMLAGRKLLEPERVAAQLRASVERNMPHPH